MKVLRWLLILVSCMGALQAFALDPAASGRIYPIVQSLGGDVKLIQYGPERAVEQLHGKAALAHLQNLRARRPDVFGKAGEQLRAHGYKPTDEVFVERHLRLAKSQDSRTRSPFLLTQSASDANSDGEIVFWSWDDGDNSTWEGTIYVEVYSNGAAATFDGQLDIAADDLPWTWYEKTWERAPQVETLQPVRQRLDLSTPPLPGGFTRAGIQLASMKNRVNPNYQLVDFYNWAICWRRAVVTGCGAGAMRCRFLGPAWAACAAEVCVSIEVAGAIGCAL